MLDMIHIQFILVFSHGDLQSVIKYFYVRKRLSFIYFLYLTIVICIVNLYPFYVNIST